MRTIRDARPDHMVYEVAPGIAVLRPFGDEEASAWGANAGIVLGGESVLLVDTRRSAAQARELGELVAELTPKPVRYVVNTHAHSDHSLGSWLFADAGAEVVRHPACEAAAAELHAGIAAAAAERPDFAGTRYVAAGRLVRGLETLRLGGGVEAVVTQARPGAAHTAGDLVVWLADASVLFAGDLVFAGYHPNVSENDVDLEGWLEGLEALARLRPRVVVPGHGDPGGPELIEAQAEYLRALRDAVGRGRERGAGAEVIAEVAAELRGGANAGLAFGAIVPANVARLIRC